MSCIKTINRETKNWSSIRLNVGISAKESKILHKIFHRQYIKKGKPFASNEGFLRKHCITNLWNTIFFKTYSPSQVKMTVINQRKNECYSMSPISQKKKIHVRNWKKQKQTWDHEYSKRYSARAAFKWKAGTLMKKAKVEWCWILVFSFSYFSIVFQCLAFDILVHKLLLDKMFASYNIHWINWYLSNGKQCVLQYNPSTIYLPSVGLQWALSLSQGT